IFHASRIVDPVHADRAVAAGDIDVVGMTRALIADPDLPRKAREGRLDDIRTCVGANEGCIDRIYQGKPVTCVQNPATGREAELADVHAATRRKLVVVVGGGVAGLEAARMAATRGHRVVLFEKAAELGGQVLLAARAPARAEYAGIVRFLVAQVEKLAVKIRRAVEATPSAVLAERPDVVIVATGSHPHIPPLPGCDGKHVVTNRDVLSGEAKVGANVVVVDDVHTQEALSTAELLLEQGKRVEVISPLFYVGQDIGVTSIAPLYTRLYTRGVVLTPGTELRAVEGSTVVVANVYSGAERRIEPVDTVVMAAGSRSTDSLYRALKGRVSELYAVGDCVAPRGVHQAILDATRVARRLRLRGAICLAVDWAPAALLAACIALLWAFQPFASILRSAHSVGSASAAWHTMHFEGLFILSTTLGPLFDPFTPYHFWQFSTCILLALVLFLLLRGFLRHKHA